MGSNERLLSKPAGSEHPLVNRFVRMTLRDPLCDHLVQWIDAKGGVKRGFTYGKTDDIDFHVLENKMHVNDVHATILHLLGFDHTELT